MVPWKRKYGFGSAFLSPVRAESPHLSFPWPTTVILILPSRTWWVVHPKSVPGDEKGRLSFPKKHELSTCEPSCSLQKLSLVLVCLLPTFGVTVLKTVTFHGVQWAQPESKMSSLWLSFNQEGTQRPYVNQEFIEQRPDPILPQEYSMQPAGNCCREEQGWWLTQSLSCVQSRQKALEKEKAAVFNKMPSLDVSCVVPLCCIGWVRKKIILWFSRILQIFPDCTNVSCRRKRGYLK